MSDSPAAALPSSPEPAPAPVPAAPGLVELLELSLHALVDARGVFARLAARPVPSAAVSIAAIACWSAAASAVTIALAAIAAPSAGAALLIAVAGAVVGALVRLLFAFVWAGLMLLIGRAAGGSASYARALSFAALVWAIGFAMALCAELPLLWLAPTALSFWLTACGLELLLGARRGPAVAVSAAIFGAAIGLRLVADSVRRTARESADAAATARAAQELAAQLQPVTLPGPAVPSALPAGAAAPGALMTPAPIAPPAGGAAPAAGASGLDLVGGGGGGLAPGAGAPTSEPEAAAAATAQASAAARDLGASAARMIDSLIPMVDAMARRPGLNAAQRAELANLRKTLPQLAALQRSGQLDPAEQQKRMAEFQAVMLRYMGASLPKGGAAPAEGGRAK